MSWIQVQIDSISENIEALEEILLSLGSCSITFSDGSDQPLYEPELGTTPLWDSTLITGLFEANYSTDRITLALSGTAKSLYTSYKIEALEDKDWEREWVKHFKPICFGGRLWVCPSWTAPPEPESVNVMLDPGLAFGTGSHPTTALCLRWLDLQCLDGKRVLDYGCGSGILAIASCLLGANQVVGVDIDPQALQATTKNGKQNNIDDSLLTCYLPKHCPEYKADIVIANILASPLKQLAETLAGYTISGGSIILSGLLESQIEEVILCYEPYFDIKERIVSDGWVLLEGIRNIASLDRA